MNELQFESAAALLDHYAQISAKFYPSRAPRQMIKPAAPKAIAKPVEPAEPVEPEPLLSDFVAAPVRFACIEELGWERPRWRRILTEVAVKHRIAVVDLTSPRRDRPSVRARHEAMWRMRTETPMSLPDIGRRLGGRDHTTIMHGIAKYQAQIDAGEAV